MNQKNRLLMHLQKNQSVLITGPAGIGKTHLLKTIAQEKNIKNRLLYFPAPTAIKNILNALCQKLNLDFKTIFDTMRPSLGQLSHYLENETPQKKFIIVLDNLHKLKASDVDTILLLMQKHCLLAATTQLDNKLKKLAYRFKKITLEPLSKEAAQQLISTLLKDCQVTDYPYLERKILHYAQGLPQVIIDIINDIKDEEIIDLAVIRHIYHDAGTNYRDWTPLFFILWGLIIMFRFIALGMRSVEGYVLAGIGTSLFMVSRYLFRSFGKSARRK
jgi:type II secretory pathway predicted ATPase ExeA